MQLKIILFLWFSTECVSVQTFAPKLVILDFSDMCSMEEVVAEVVDCYGCVDVLICNSSMKLKAPVQSVSLELDRNIMDINYFGPSTLAKGGRGSQQEKLWIQGLSALVFTLSVKMS